MQSPAWYQQISEIKSSGYTESQAYITSLIHENVQSINYFSFHVTRGLNEINGASCIFLVLLLKAAWIVGEKKAAGSF